MGSTLQKSVTQLPLAERASTVACWPHACEREAPQEKSWCLSDDSPVSQASAT